MDQDELIACRECDTLHHRPALEKRSVARCTRCGSVLYRRITDSLERLLAVTVAALITFLIAQAFPIVELETNGIATITTLIGAIVILWSENMQLVAVVVFFTTILVPLAELAALLYVLAPLLAGVEPPGFNLALRLIQALRPWGMLEVFMLGVLVTVVKLSSIASVLPQPGVFAFGALTFLVAGLAAFDPRNLWYLADQLPPSGARTRLARGPAHRAPLGGAARRS